MALGKKLNLGTRGTAPPIPKRRDRATPTQKPRNLPAPADMQKTGTLTTGEHPGRDAYFKRSGRTKDPLEATGGQVQRSFVNQTEGPRKGQTALEILKGGAKYHVYYGPKGTRSVFRVPTRTSRGMAARASATGASLSRV